MSGQEQEEGLAETSMHYASRVEGTEMSWLVEYGLDGSKSTATPQVQIMRHDTIMTTDKDETQEDEGCEQRRQGGRHGEQLERRSSESPLERRASRCGDHRRIEARQE